MVKYAIFFGAGASLGSGCNQPERPPSGDELFKKLCKFNPKLWEKYSDLFENVHFETGWHCLKEKCILNKNDLFMYELHQDLGRFFLRYKINSDNLYAKLANQVKTSAKLKGWDGCFISINYDILLQQALNADSSYKPFLCLPHGSSGLAVNFSNGINLGTNSWSKIYSDGPSILGISYELPYNFYWDEKIYNHNQDIYLPLMSYYSLSKTTHFNMSFIKEHKKSYSEIVKSANVIIIIGVYPSIESDPHLWDEALASSKAYIHYFNPSAEDRGKFQEWAKSKELKFKCYKENFEQALYKHIYKLVNIS